MLRPLILTLLAAGPVAAHPHVFVTTTVEIRLDDDGRLVGVGIAWTYDDFFSLLMTEDLGLDPDGDLVLTDAETTALADYMAWPADFEGDVYLTRNSAPLMLGPVEDHAIRFEAGRVTEAYVRPLAIPEDTITAPVDVRIYDPFYYVAYEISPQITVTGRDGCTATLVKADLNAAYALAEEALYGRPAADVGPDEQFPEVGQAFADTVRVACGG